MTVKECPYDHGKDFDIVRAFLCRTFFQKDSYQLWIPSRFENSVFNEDDPSKFVHLWYNSSTKNDNYTPFLVGLVILNPPNDFILISHPNYKYLVEEMVNWTDAQLENSESSFLSTYSLKDDTIQNAILTKLGYKSLEVSEHIRTRSLDTPIQNIVLPGGFQIRQIGEDDYDQYIKAVEIVFQHPHFTHEVYKAMRKTHFYHEDLSLGVFTDNGTLAAFCMLRIDEYKIAEFEPVGTLPEFRKQGLARALMSECIFRAKKFTPLLFYVGGAATEEADRLYEHLGFQNKTEIYRWIKKID